MSKPDDVKAGDPKRWLRPALLGWGLLCGLVLGPLFLFNGGRAIDRGGQWWDTVGGWFMTVGGVMALVGGLALLALLRRKPSD